MKIPPKYIITPEILEYLAKIEATREYLKSLNVSPVINQKIQRVSLLKSSLFSAKIEGNPLRIEDLEDSSQETKKIEVENILKSINYVSKLEVKQANIATLKTLHKITMGNIYYPVGQFRQEISAIFNQAGIAVYVCPSPSQITDLISQLLKYVNSEEEKFPLIKAFITHLVFEKIHPFLDGNGRVGRLLIYLVCKLNNYVFYPNISFEEYLNENKNDYYYFLDVGLRKPQEYLLFMLKAFYNQAEKLKKEVEEEINNKNIINLPPRQEEILQIIKDHQIISFDFLRRRFLEIPPRTLRYDLKKICDKKLVVKIGQTRGSYYKII